MATNFPTSLDALRANQGLVDGNSIITAAPHNNLMDAVDALQAKVGVNSSAVATSFDYRMARKGTLASGSTVFNTHVTTANTWQDLDLSATVGAKVVLCFLEVAAGGGPVNMAVKPKDAGSATFTYHIYPDATSCGAGAAATTINNGYYRYLVCATNSSGIIQIGCSANNVTLTIKLIAYVG
jgi:hypothetical protein